MTQLVRMRRHVASPPETLHHPARDVREPHVPPGVEIGLRLVIQAGARCLYPFFNMQLIVMREPNFRAFVRFER